MVAPAVAATRRVSGALVIGRWGGTLKRYDGATIALTLHTTASGATLLQRGSWRSVEGPITEPASGPRIGAAHRRTRLDRALNGTGTRTRTRTD